MLTYSNFLLSNFIHMFSKLKYGLQRIYNWEGNMVSGIFDLFSVAIMEFRDLSNVVANTGLAAGQINVQGVPYTGTLVPTSIEPMFLSEGIINSNYINSNKPWYEQRKFVDKFLGIRLIANNLSRNLINLYTVTAALRVSPR
mgnify:CR=1 FL=1